MVMIGPAEADRVEAAFDDVQKQTEAPLVCVLARSSGSRDAEFLLGACILALATPLPLLLFTEMSAQRIYVAQLLVAILAAVLGAVPWVRRALIPARAVRSACHRMALAQFVLRGLDRSQCGVLIYVSLAEHYIRILPAEAAAAAIPHDAWQAAVDKALVPLAAGAIEAALTDLADDCARLLAKPFPPATSWTPPQRQRFHVL
jgi:putative membrane protein